MRRRPHGTQPRRLTRTHDKAKEPAVESAQIQACAASARRECFRSRACSTALLQSHEGNRQLRHKPRHRNGERLSHKPTASSRSDNRPRRATRSRACGPRLRVVFSSIPDAVVTFRQKCLPARGLCDSLATSVVRIGPTAHGSSLSSSLKSAAPRWPFGWCGRPRVTDRETNRRATSRLRPCHKPCNKTG